LLSNRDAPPSQSGDETKFHEVHYTKRDNNTKIKEEATVSATFSSKGVFIEEQPSGDYLDDIPPSCVRKYFVDPKTSTFCLVVNRKGSYASSPYVEYTISLATKYIDFMMTCWKEIIKGHGDSSYPRDGAFEDVLAPRSHRENGKSRKPASPPHGDDDDLSQGLSSPPLPFFLGGTTPFGQEEYSPRTSTLSKMDNNFAPRNYALASPPEHHSHARKPKYNPHSFSTSDLPPAPKQYQQQSQKRDLLIDL